MHAWMFDESFRINEVLRKYLLLTCKLLAMFGIPERDTRTSWSDEYSHFAWYCCTCIRTACGRLKASILHILSYSIDQVSAILSVQMAVNNWPKREFKIEQPNNFHKVSAISWVKLKRLRSQLASFHLIMYRFNRLRWKYLLRRGHLLGTSNCSRSHTGDRSKRVAYNFKAE